MSIARLTRTMALSRAFEVLPPILSEATEGVPVPRNSEATKLRPEILLMRGDGASVPFVYKMKSLALSHVRVLASTIIVKNFNGNDIGAFRNATERQRQEAGDKWDTRGKKDKGDAQLTGNSSSSAVSPMSIPVIFQQSDALKEMSDASLVDRKSR